MNILYIYLCILIITSIIFVLVKDKVKALTLIGNIAITSSIVLLILSLITKIIVNNYITKINLSVITNYLFKKIMHTNIIIFLIGISCIVASKYIFMTTKKIQSK